MANNLQQYATNFAVRISEQITDMGLGSYIKTAEQKLLAFNLYVKGNAALEEANLKWNQIDGHKFMAGTIDAVLNGLNAENNEVYTIPWRNPKTGLYDLQVTTSAWGYRKIAIESCVGKKLVDIQPFVIREGDSVTLHRKPNNDEWELNVDPFSEAEIKGYLTIATYEDGTSQVMTHTLGDIEKRKQASKAANSPAWRNWPVEMAIAKAVKRHSKRIPKSRKPVLEERLDQISFDKSEAIIAEAYSEVTEEIKELPTETIDAGEFLGEIKQESKQEEPAEVEAEVRSENPQFVDEVVNDLNMAVDRDGQMYMDDMFKSRQDW